MIELNLKLAHYSREKISLGINPKKKKISLGTIGCSFLE